MNPNRLTWLCRRGMRELDIPLNRYLASGYPAATAEEREQFHRLLEESDSRLWHFFYQGLTPEDTALAALIEKIRRTAAPHS